MSEYDSWETNQLVPKYQASKNKSGTLRIMIEGCEAEEISIREEIFERMDREKLNTIAFGDIFFREKDKYIISHEGKLETFTREEVRRMSEEIRNE